MTNIPERLHRRVLQAVNRPGPVPFFSFETILLLLSLAYGAVVRLRARLYATGVLPTRSLPCPVISIGNITTGGTGKTPFTIMIARLIQSMGYRGVVVSRGYRGTMEQGGGIVSDGRTILAGVEAAGDEPYLMARVLPGIPVMVGSNRYKVGLMAVNAFHPDVVILDDAYQHIRLGRDVNLVLLDARAPLGNGYLLPRGTLREPVSALQRADALIMTRCDPHTPPRRVEGLPTEQPVIHTMHAPVVRPVRVGDGRSQNPFTDMAALRGRRAVAFAGLADNTQFFDALVQAGCILERSFAFTDHHRYARRDLADLAAAADRCGSDCLVTSFKDYVKIERWIEDLPGLVVVDVVIEVVAGADWLATYLSRLLMPRANQKRTDDRLTADGITGGGATQL